MDPEEFRSCMQEISDDPNTPLFEAVRLMCELLTSLGYGDGVQVFERMDKYYE